MSGVDIQKVKLDRITFAYTGRPPVFENFSFEPPEHPLVWIKSEPGAGKSTLLKILAGLVTPQSGRFLINGKDVLDLSFKEFLPYRMHIGYSFDTGGLLSNRTLYENILLPLVFHNNVSAQEANDRVLFWMAKFNILKVKDQRPFFVTGGHRKSAIVLRTFIHYPQFVLLDDPMAGLKEDGRRAFVELFDECVNLRGLKQLLYCAERELPIRSVIPKAVFLSKTRSPIAEAA